MPAAWIFKKKDLCPTWDKSLCFCDTTQIDILRCPLAFTHHHAYPTDNGRVPVGPYLGKFPVQAALGRPFTPLRTAPISPPEALLGCPVLCYSSSSQVCRLKLGAFRLSKKLPSQKFRREGKCERLTIKSQARNAEERQKFRRFKRGIAKLTSFWTPT